MNRSVQTRVLKVTQSPATAHLFLCERGFVLSSSGLAPPALAASFGIFSVFTFCQSYQVISSCGCSGMAMLFFSATAEMHHKCVKCSIEEAVAALAHTPVEVVIVRWALTNCEDKHRKFTRAALAERVARAKELSDAFVDDDEEDETNADEDESWVEEPSPYEPDNGEAHGGKPWNEPAPWEDDHFGDPGDPWHTT